MDELDYLFVDMPPRESEPSHLWPALKRTVWTENKANFIARYLQYFVYITKHGTYIDGFAGSQWADRPDAWAAKLVLANEPCWFRHFHLCEMNRKSFRRLRELEQSQPLRDSRGAKIKRDVSTYHGDFNVIVDEILNSGIDTTEATFCLLDQRTFECHWSTVVKLARHKPEGSNKIELFYFLAVKWIHRSLSGVKGDKAEKWWGDASWRDLQAVSQEGIVNLLVERFQKELGYKWVIPFPIFAREEGGPVMFHMIHASDHDDAPKQMFRAYNAVVGREIKEVQSEMNFDDMPPIDCL